MPSISPIAWLRRRREAMHAVLDQVFQHEPAVAAEMLAGDADVVAQPRPHGGDAEPVGAEQGFAGGAHGSGIKLTSPFGRGRGASAASGEGGACTDINSSSLPRDRHRGTRHCAGDDVSR